MRLSECLLFAMLVLLLSTLLPSESFAQSMAGRKEVTLDCRQSVLTENGYGYDEIRVNQIWDITFKKSYPWHPTDAYTGYGLEAYDLNGAHLSSGSIIEYTSTGGAFAYASLYSDCIQMTFLNTDKDAISGTYETNDHNNWTQYSYCQAVSHVPDIYGAYLGTIHCNVKMKPQKVKK